MNHRRGHNTGKSLTRSTRGFLPSNGGPSAVFLRWCWCKSCRCPVGVIARCRRKTGTQSRQWSGGNPDKSRSLELLREQGPAALYEEAVVHQCSSKSLVCNVLTRRDHKRVLNVLVVKHLRWSTNKGGKKKGELEGSQRLSEDMVQTKCETR